MRRKVNKSIPPSPEKWVTSRKCDRKIEKAELAARRRIMGDLHPQNRKQASSRKRGASTRGSSDKEFLENGKESYPLLYWYGDPSQPMDR
jgi:hypothetical protein